MMVLFTTFLAVAADIEVTHQGRLLDSVGAPITGTHALRVALYAQDDDLLADALFAETFDTVSVSGGYYTVVLGRDGAPVLDSSLFANDVWLEVTVDPDTSAETTILPRQKLTDVPGASAVGTGTSADSAAFSCLELKNQGVTDSGLYWINPTGYAPVQTWCDMVTDGGGWTLVSHAWADSGGYSNNHYSLRCGGGDFSPMTRGVTSGAIRAVELAQASTEFGLSMNNGDTIGMSGDMTAYTRAFKFLIPDPSAITFANHSSYNPNYGADAGPCVAVTVTRLHPTPTTATRYTHRNSLGTTWSDTYPGGYGAGNTTNCQNFSSGPSVPSIHSGSYRGTSSGYDGQSCDVPRGSRHYYHRGNFFIDSYNNDGSSALWLR